MQQLPPLFLSAGSLVPSSTQLPCGVLQVCLSASTSFLMAVLHRGRLVLPVKEEDIPPALLQWAS